MKRLEDGTTYIITGDIPAMWLRDSVAQIRPYLMAAGEDKEIADMLVGLVRKQFFYVNLDPYANAFNQEANGNCWEHDETDMLPWIWERKYEPVSYTHISQDGSGNAAGGNHAGT